jgi:hypothetical protein
LRRPPPFPWCPCRARQANLAPYALYSRAPECPSRRLSPSPAPPEASAAA